MTYCKIGGALLALGLILGVPMTASAQSKGKVLVVMSSAHVQNAAPWHPNVVQDRELITAQQPFSDHMFADALLAKLTMAAH